MMLYTDAARTRKGFLICYTDADMNLKQVRHLPYCNKSHEAEIEAVKLAMGIENVETICTDSLDAIRALSETNPKIQIVKIPRMQNIANQVLLIYKENFHRKNYHVRTQKSTPC